LRNRELEVAHIYNYQENCSWQMRT